MNRAYFAISTSHQGITTTGLRKTVNSFQLFYFVLKMLFLYHQNLSLNQCIALMLNFEWFFVDSLFHFSFWHMAVLRLSLSLSLCRMKIKILRCMILFRRTTMMVGGKE